MNISEFFDSEFKVFSNLDNVRSIPSVIDGFKDSQRKALYGMLNRPNKEIKVAQAGSECALVSHYNHGESSMCDTIVGLAQNYPGSNNINLFEPIGQFGSILSSTSSSHRYIYTKLSEHVHTYLSKEDEQILEYKYEDGDKVEPKIYLPTIPFWLVNGSVGIGTGHSVKILPRNPTKLKQLFSKLAQGVQPQQKTLSDTLLPYYEGWQGEVIDNGDGSYKLLGKIEIINMTTLRITEVPPNKGIDKVKTDLIKLMDNGHVRDYDNNSSENGFDILVTVPRQIGKKPIDELIKLFKLSSNVSENITLWDTKGYLRKYENVLEAIEEFIQYKLSSVESRRLAMISVRLDQLEYLNQRILFIQTWHSIINHNTKSIDELKSEMLQAGVYDKYIDSLMSLRISSLSKTKIDEYKKEIQNIAKEIKALELVTNQELYLNDLKTIS